MTEQERLRAKHAEAIAKLRQMEADIYFMQGYIKALEEEMGVTLDELKQAIGAQSIEVTENE